jgi:hypothetical protein
MKILFALALVFSPLAFAEESEPCREDIKKFCGDVKPGAGAVIKCMKEHINELSPACREKIAKGKEKMEERRAAKKEKRSIAREACADDMKKLCGDVEPGKGGKLHCLKEKKAELSEGCRESLAR